MKRLGKPERATRGWVIARWGAKPERQRRGSR